jgi:hypothetical protein
MIARTPRYLPTTLIVSLLTIMVVGAQTASPTASPTATFVPTPTPVAVSLTATPTPTVTEARASSSPGSAPINPSPAGKFIDVSKIVGKTEAEKILGESVRDPQPLNTTGPDGYYSKCNYYSSKSTRSLLLRVRQASASSIDPQKELDQVAASGGTMKPVDGLGDKAGMFNGTPQNGLPPNVIMLYVVKGNAFITIGVGGMKDEEAALVKAKGVASKLLAKL